MLLEWIPRDANAEADALADGDYTGFNPSRRQGTDLDGIAWKVLPGLMSEGQKYYDQGVGRGRPAAAPARLKGQKRLREREPW